MSVPPSLVSLQTWVARLLVLPLRKTGCFCLPVYDRKKQKEIEKRITAGPQLTPQQRIAIYNQQYWFRLFNLMQGDYPLLIRLFGCADFNRKIAEPYLLKYVPDHWGLACLGSRLPQWIEEEYHEEDKRLVIGAAQMDEAYNRLFFAERKTPLASEDLACIEERPIFLQPFVALFAFDADLFAFRKALLAKDSEYWMQESFPSLHWSKKRYFALHCSACGTFGCEELSVGEFTLLKAFEKGATLDEALSLCSEEIASQIGEWFCKWAKNGWLTIDIHFQ